MTREPDANLPVIFRIDGRKIRSAKDFHREIGSSVNGPGGYFGRNLDALADCLRGDSALPRIGPTNSNAAQRPIAALPQRRAPRAAHVVRCDAGGLQRRRSNAEPQVNESPCE